jgi:hypothetical protein
MRCLAPVLPLTLFACAGSTAGAGSDSAVAGDDFCATLDDGGRSLVEAGGGSGASGALALRVITSASDDPRDPMYVAFKDYTLENTETGGLQTTGTTSGDGLVDELLGAGPWRFRASLTRGSTTCTAQLELDIEAGSTTRACAVMTCP